MGREGKIMLGYPFHRKEEDDAILKRQPHKLLVSCWIQGGFWSWTRKPTTTFLWMKAKAIFNHTEASVPWCTDTITGQGPQTANVKGSREKKISSALEVIHQLEDLQENQKCTFSWGMKQVDTKTTHFKNTMQRKNNAQGQALSFMETIHYEMLFYPNMMSTRCQQKKDGLRLCNHKTWVSAFEKLWLHQTTGKPFKNTTTSGSYRPLKTLLAAFGSVSLPQNFISVWLYVFSMMI